MTFDGEWISTDYKVIENLLVHKISEKSLMLLAKSNCNTETKNRSWSLLTPYKFILFVLNWNSCVYIKEVKKIRSSFNLKHRVRHFSCNVLSPMNQHEYLYFSIHCVFQVKNTSTQSSFQYCTRFNCLSNKIVLYLLFVAFCYFMMCCCWKEVVTEVLFCPLLVP